MISRHSVLAAIAAITVTMAAPASAENYSPVKVIQAMKVNNPHLRIIAAHRGHFMRGCPENSICSIDQTANDGVEAVEIDVRESADGTLWPIHDTNIGRMTNYTSGGHLFDPFARSAANDRSNPAISSTRDDLLRTLKLRDVEGNVTRYPFQLLEAMVHDADVRNRNLVYVFDIKTGSAIIKTAAMIRRLRIQDRSILKFNSTLVDPGSLGGIMQGLHFVPVIGTGSLDQIVDHYHLEKPTPAERVNAYVYDFARTSGFVYFEVRNKMFSGSAGGDGSGVRVEGPLTQVDFYMALMQIPQGGYAPFPEHYSVPGQPGTGYYYVNGQCCHLLTDHFDQSRYFGSDTRDDRESLGYMLGYNAVVISDLASRALDRARQMGARADAYKILY